MFCRKCGIQIPDDSKFCTSCGTKVEYKTASTIDEQPQQAWRNCTNCGSLIPKEIAFCPNCGTGLNNTYTQSNGASYGKTSSSYEPKPAQKAKLNLSPKAIKAIIIGAIGLIIILIFLFTRPNIVFASLQPNTVNRFAGNGVISYDLNNQNYTKEYLGKVQIAKTKKNCGYIVSYKSRMERISDQYVYSYSGSNPYMGGMSATVRQEIIDVEIYDIHTGKIIASKTFEASLPFSTESFTFYVKKEDIANWIYDNIK